MSPKIVARAQSCNYPDSYRNLLYGLSARPIGQTYMARCPAHEDRTPSLSITLSSAGKVLVKCHAGCSQSTVIETLRVRGLWPFRGPLLTNPDRSRKTSAIKPQAHASQAALHIWNESHPAAGTIVERYLSSRCLAMPPAGVLRFHPSLRHPSGARVPAMVALVTRGADGTPCAIHRTYLATDGMGKAPVEPAKMMLGPCGGGVVRLAPCAGNQLMVGEGIETCLAAMQVTGRVTWAALSTSGLCTLTLPTDVAKLTILADGDPPGEKAARACASRVIRTVEVRIARPPAGLDFADMLVREAR